MATISVRAVEKRFGSGPAVLRDCDLEIGDHEFLVLVGPSGSGKTTLLRIIAGLEDPTGGELYFGDRLVNDIDVGDRDIAMVFQNYGLYPHMTVRNNMAFGLRRRKVEKPEIDRKVSGAAKMLGIEHLLDRRPRQLSGGQRQRVALGRAIVRDPAVFLLDEPLSNLDAHLRLQMRTEILRVHRAVTATTVYVTHDQVEAMTMGDRIAVMHDGLIQQVGTPTELYDHPVNRFVAGFIGTPAMGFVTCTVSRKEGRVDLVRQGVNLRLTEEDSAKLTLADGAVAVAGIRPEEFRLVPADSWDEETSLVRGAVEVVEPLGPEQHLIVDVGGEMVTARVHRDVDARPGEKVGLAVSGKSVHVFSSESGESLL
ncbi:MAG TPA: sn-glycerol-3-phosphate ABC transporter ATP-binding protein UgpC [Acidimicrobiales bacterium]|nr:sn-glycerol-3-phosphate ABC transporter ATP-binding protein UgpC [Acidimicrobiales bacterium]